MLTYFLDKKNESDRKKTILYPPRGVQVCSNLSIAFNNFDYGFSDYIRHFFCSNFFYSLVF